MLSESKRQVFPNGSMWWWWWQDTPGWYPEASQEMLHAIMNHVLKQCELYFDAEKDPLRSVPQWEIPDTRVDICLFLLPHEGPGPATVAFLHSLGTVVPVLPLIAKVGLLCLFIHCSSFPSVYPSCSVQGGGLR